MEDVNAAVDSGKLYRLDHDLSITSTINNLQITNSLCWSPNSHTLYHCDTPTREINSYAYDPDTGQLAMPDVFTKTESKSFPDGSTVDSQGYLWNAQWGGSKVVRYSPNGTVDLVLDLPVSQVSCVAFGGRELNLLLVTTANQGLTAEKHAEEPRAGNLFIYETDYMGLMESPFMPNRTPGIERFN